MARTELVLLVLSPGTEYHAEAAQDAAAFVERRSDALYRVAGERLHDERLLPVAKGSPWAVVLPGTAVDLETVRGLYGDELAAKVAQGVADNPDAIVMWQVVKCVVKGRG